MRRLLCSFLFAACLPNVVLAAVVRTPHAEAELVAESTAFEPGKPLSIALRLKAIPGWHTYWRNPGDSGLATSLAWKLPADFEAGPIQWPYPERMDYGPLTNFGYEGEVLLPVQIRAPSRVDGRDVSIAARADWLVCDPETCIPEHADLRLTLPVGVGKPSTHAGAFETTRRALPSPAALLSGWEFSASRADNGPVIVVTAPPGKPLAGLTYFPYDEGKIEHNAAQTLERDGDTYRLPLTTSRQPVGTLDRMHGVLVAADGFAGMKAVEIDLPLSAAVAQPLTASLISFGAALLFAFIGGLILNLMPCVLPVISIKVLGFVEHSRQHARTAHRHGLMFAAGIVLSFWLLAVLLLALRTLGAELGWGFQLQSPVIVTILALFFFAIGLNLSGLYELGTALPDSLAAWRARNPYVDSFLSGVLAVAVASPCTAPFMGAALGYAVGQSGVAALSVFTALGVGMALPYVLLAWHPRWLKLLPAPGAWMLRLKQFLAFPMYGTAIWLAWVLGIQAGLDAVIALLIAVLLLGLGAWMLGTSSSRKIRFAAVALSAAAVFIALPDKPSAPLPTTADSRWQTFSAERVAEETAAGRTVFVDFTAAWCVTCQVNKMLVLNTDEVMKAFDQHGVTLLRADWTQRDAAITRALAQFGRSGVPLYVLHRPRQAAILLPEILTRDIVLDALAGAE